MARIVDDEEEVAAVQEAVPTPPPRAEAPAAPAAPPAPTIDSVRLEVQKALCNFPRLPVGYRYGIVGNPKSVVDLKVLPADVQTPHGDGPTNRLLVMLPKGRFPNVEASRLKLTSDMMIARERGRVGGPIFSLHFVQLGDSIAQVHVEFLHSTDATLVAEQLRSARYEVGFGAPSTPADVAPSSVLQVSDFGKKVANGDVIDPATLFKIFSVNPGDMSVVKAFVDEVVYVAFARSSSLYSVLCSPFYSGSLQAGLWRFGVFVSAVHTAPSTLARVIRGVQQDQSDHRAPPEHGPSSLALRPQPTAASSSDDDQQSDSAADVLDGAAYDSSLFGHENGAGVANRAAMLQGSTQATGLPPELLALLEDDADAAPASRDGHALLPTPPALGPILETPGGLTWNAATTVVGDSAPANPIGEVVTPAEEELIASVAAAEEVDATIEALQAGLAGDTAVSEAAKGHLVRVLSNPASRLLRLLDVPAFSALAAEHRLTRTPAFLHAIRRHLPMLMGRSTLPGAIADLARHVGATVFEACLTDQSVNRVQSSLANSQNFGRNLTTLLGLLPSGELASDADEAAQAAAKAVRAAMTAIIVGPVWNALVHTGAGARFVEHAARTNRVERGVLARFIANRLTSNGFVLASLGAHLSVAAETLGAEPETDVLLIKALTAHLHLPEVQRFLRSAGPARVHKDALPLIIENLEGAAAGEEEFRLRRFIAGHFAHRWQDEQQRARGAAAVVPAWIAAVGAQYVSPRSPPFPPLPRGWSVSSSASNGLYFYTRGGLSTYEHPVTRREYTPMPQAYVWERLLSVNDLVDMCRRFARPVDRAVAEKWLQDQRVRNAALDESVVAALEIVYPASAPQSNELSADTEPSKLHRKEDDATQNKPADIPDDVSVALSKYPATGDPYPPLPPGYTAKVSTSNGYYYFIAGDEKSSTSYKHPVDGETYPVAPQHFFEKSGVPIDVFCKDFDLDQREVQQWAKNQAQRLPHIDSAVVDAFGLKYKMKSHKDKKRDEK